MNEANCNLASLLTDRRQWTWKTNNMQSIFCVVLTRWTWRCCEGLMLADSVLQPPQGSNCEWSLTQGAGCARTEWNLAVVNSHYSVESTSLVLNSNNYRIPAGCQGSKSSTSCKTFKKRYCFASMKEQNEKGGPFLLHCSSWLTFAESGVTARAVWHLSIHLQRSVRACVCVCERAACACVCRAELWTGMTG